jgi:hypothetical protein
MIRHDEKCPACASSTTVWARPDGTRPVLRCNALACARQGALPPALADRWYAAYPAARPDAYQAGLPGFGLAFA